MTTQSKTQVGRPPKAVATISKAAQLRNFQNDTINKVLDQVKQFQEMDALDLPKDYSPSNALKAAWFTLLKTKDKNNNPVLENCTKISIINSLMEMVTQGLNPAKLQCAFIAYGNQLTLQREYFGTIALAKRYSPEIAEVNAAVIYKDDVFKYEIDPGTGKKRLIEHSQSIDNLDNEIIGAYATIVFKDGKSEIEPMTITMIHKSWNKGAMKGKSSAHLDFTDQMCKKTVINRACKPYINASNDSELVSIPRSNEVLPGRANTVPLGIEYQEDDAAIEEGKVKSLKEADKTKEAVESKVEKKAEPEGETKQANQGKQKQTEGNSVKNEPKLGF